MESADSILFPMDGTEYIKRLVGSNLKYLREQRQLTQDDLAAMIDVTGKTITNIENAGTFPKPETIYRLSKAFDISPAELFLSEEERRYTGLDSIMKSHIRKEVERLHKALDAFVDKEIPDNPEEN